MKTKISKWFKKYYYELYNQLHYTTHTHSNGSVNPFHQEGSVLSHTSLVLDLVENNSNQIFAALLHDIGKIYTRREKSNGHVSFKYHENVSMFKSIDILKHASREFDIDILLILQLIAWHGTLWNKTPVTERLKYIDKCYGHKPEVLKALISFTESDAYGRKISSKYNDELVFLDKQFNFLHNYIPYNTQAFKENKSSDAIFLIGVSGSGKSTYIENNFPKDTDIVSIDNYFYKKNIKYDYIDYKKNIEKAHNQSLVSLSQFVNEQKNIIIDMTNLSKEIRRKKLSKIPVTKYNHKAIVFLNGENSIRENLLRRDHKQLDENIIINQIKQFEIPNYDEFDEITYIF